MAPRHRKPDPISSSASPREPTPRTSAQSESGIADPRAATVLAVSLLCHHPQVARELLPLIERALPGEAVKVFTSATEAQAPSAVAQGDHPVLTLYILDFRGEPVGALAAQVQQIRRLTPDAELMVVSQTGDNGAFAACLRVAGSPDGLTFLLAPLQPSETVGAIRSVAERAWRAREALRLFDDSRHKARRLELQVQELGARLDIARHAAKHDDLTGVLNRPGFLDELTQRLSRGRQPQNVLMIDLDRFKAVNDTLGHSAGDELVRKICLAIGSVIPSGGILARLGGDEFGVIVEATSDLGIDDICTQILKVCAQSRLIGGHEVQVTASIGVARQTAGHREVELMRQADLALYAAKREGRNRSRHFDAALDQATKYRLSIEGGLERALRGGQFKMAYQPIIVARTGEVVGYEALVRWDSPEYGAISPAEFIPIAEETGLILDIGDWITRQALKDCRRWNGPYVSINLSARQFLRHNVAERILQYAADADLAPQRIQIELTETAIIDDVERADHNLQILRAAGVRVALDDFGTGYSSLVYLNRFAIDCIKIDKSFVDNITTDRQSAMIVASVTKLANSLGMTVVAEGVETEAQSRVLIAAGCDLLQGYLYGKPVGAVELIVPPAFAPRQDAEREA
jgi:diguanylate cyclase (GGDEF)-like protein